MANIYDVAKRAKVSIATVSRYFNNGYVSQDSGERIKEAIDELGYSVSQVAAAMMTKSLKAIGLILPSITNQFFPELAKAVEERAHKKGYTLFVCNSEGSEAKETGFINMLKSLHADGIITATGNCAHIYRQKKIPVVSIDRDLEGDFIHVTS
ncbi:MAG TPA: LacI family transcriptional regulator, partial [Clostridiales bacterium]|nr:LacI family transcriptional regulator [Clostridiales bacterium]